MKTIWKKCPDGCVGEGRRGKVKAIGTIKITGERAQTLAGEWGRVQHEPLECGHFEYSLMLGDAFKELGKEG